MIAYTLLTHLHTHELPNDCIHIAYTFADTLSYQMIAYTLLTHLHTHELPNDCIHIASKNLGVT